MPHVLVVDYERKSVAGLCAELAGRGLAVDQACTEVEAMALLRTHVYVAVALNLMLPERHVVDMKRDRPKVEHGIAVLCAIRAGEFAEAGTSRSVPVFAITSLTFEARESLERVKQIGVNKTFTKPILPPIAAEEICLSIEGGRAPC